MLIRLWVLVCVIQVGLEKWGDWRLTERDPLNRKLAPQFLVVSPFLTQLFDLVDSIDDYLYFGEYSVYMSLQNIICLQLTVYAYTGDHDV
jgi:hypothetical protein